MKFSQPAGWWMLLGLIPVIAVHLLKPRRQPHVVSSTMLWERFERPVTSAAPIQRLRRSWLLLLQILAVVLLSALLANPVRVTPSAFAPHTVFLIDASGSMLSLDGTPDRLADAKNDAIKVRADLPDGSLASVVEVGANPRVLISASPDVDAFNTAVSTIQAEAGHADFAGAFDLAEGLETSDAAIGFVLISDGGLTDDQQGMIPAGTMYRPIGTSATNRGIIALDVEPRETGLHVVATVANTGGPEATQTLRLDVDGRTRDRHELTIPAGETISYEADLANGDQVEAFLEGEDQLAADNRRSAVAHRRQAVTVEVVSQGDPDPFLMTLLTSIDGVTTVTAPTRPPNSTSTSGADLLVFDGVDVPTDVSTPFIAIRSPQGAPGITVEGETEAPVPTLIRSDDALLQGLDFSELSIASSQKVTTTDDVLLGAESAPLMVRGRTDSGVRFIYSTFRPAESNLPIQVAFPILGDRLISELTGASVPPSTVEVGDVLTVPGIDGGTVTDPIGIVTQIAPGRAGVTTERPGVWKISNGRISNDVAVNPAAAESTLEPVAVIPIEKRVARAGEKLPEATTSMRPWILIALVLILIAESLVARRRVGVSQRQWHFALAARVLTGVALLLAALGVGFNRPATSVSTVFVLDVSDSLGDTGRADATKYVTDALAAMPSKSRAGVVTFGGDARIDALMSSTPLFSRPSAAVNRSATDLASALRLSGAILPDDARRRVVVVSDGVATNGDAIAEAEQLRGTGIAVDTVLINTPGSADVAIAQVKTPPSVNAGERIPIDVTLNSTLGGTATVRLRRDGKQIDTRTVELKPGPQVVSFTDVADGTGAYRYAVDVSSDRDVVSENNTAFQAVDVQGQPRVLIAEGVPGNASNLAAALQASSITTDVISVKELPAIDQLMSYSSIILVDVDQRLMTSQQVGALTGAVRDGGRGLLTIGGDQSYGLGGYYTSDLETVLPVVSEILDPKRRKSVAEVLAIDSSGSMGACHCSEGQLKSNRLDGGVNKTDISRAAAARTISAMSENDEVGVLAFNVEDRWVIDLQKVPSQEVVNAGLSKINPMGGTNPGTSLETAAEALRNSQASLKHIVLFTDGFTSRGLLDLLTEQAANLAAEGITVSVVATGEGAAGELEAVAQAGNGRFYPGRDLQKIPEIMMEESTIASRDFINEGSFLPVVRSSLPVVANLTETPPLLGYVATTAKPTATTLLSIGPENDPLLVSWKAGLGTSTAWTSDASDRWSQNWASWPGYVDFWSRVVRDTFPADSSGTTATVENGVMRVRVEGEQSFADGSTATATITDPVFGRLDVPLNRVGSDVFAADVPVEAVGSYVVGTTVKGPDGDEATIGSALASVSYSAEYVPTPPDAVAMKQIAKAGGGRTDIEPDTAFSAGGLTPGTSHIDLTSWWIVLAGLLFVFGVVASRVTLGRRHAVLTSSPIASRVMRPRGEHPNVVRPKGRRRSPVSATAAKTAPTPAQRSDEELVHAVATREATQAQNAESATLETLLARRRERREN